MTNQEYLKYLRRYRRHDGNCVIPPGDAFMKGIDLQEFIEKYRPMIIGIVDCGDSKIVTFFQDGIIDRLIVDLF